MSRNNVLKRPMPDASLPRNDFDRSKFINLNWPLGMILPVLSEFIPAGSKGRVNRSIFSRMNEVNTAAFPRLDVHMDFYMVPVDKLWSRWHDFYLNIQDSDSSAVFEVVNDAGVMTPPVNAPRANVSDIRDALAINDGATQTNDELGFNIRYGAERLLDLLGYNDRNITSATPYNMQLNTLRLQAYQYLYYKYYRNTAYESNDPFAYNADAYYNGSLSSNNGVYDVAGLRKLLKIHYVNYRKDFFTNIFPSLNFVVSSPDGRWNIPSNVLFSVTAYSTTSVFPSADGGGQTLLSSTINNNSSYSSVQQIRAAFALDKLMRATAYAPKTVKEQYKARFGINVDMGSSEYLGSFKNDISISEIVSTASTDTDALGAIGGRAVNFNGNQKDLVFHNESKSDCILVCMMYTMVRSVYDSFRVDPFNFKFSREDYFQPEFMNLGLRPITRMEYYMTNTNSEREHNYIMGYVPRNVEYKLSVDENHGLLRSDSQLAVFTNHTNASIIKNIGSAASGVNAAYFKTKPSDLNDVMVVAWQASDQKTDHFFGQIEFKLHVRQNMSVHGIPNL